MSKLQFFILLLFLGLGFGFLVYKIGVVSKGIETAKVELGQVEKRIKGGNLAPVGGVVVNEGGELVKDSPKKVDDLGHIRVMRGRYRYINVDGRVNALFEDKELWLGGLMEYGRVINISSRGAVCSNENNGVVSCLLPLVITNTPVAAPPPPRASLQAAEGGCAASVNDYQEGGETNKASCL